MDLMSPKRLEELKKLIKDDQVFKFYHWKEYKRLRHITKRRDNNECQVCKRRGKHSSYGACHHLKEVKDYPELALRLDNVEIVCKTCHNELHPEKFGDRESGFMNEEWF